MSTPIPLHEDFDGPTLRRAAKATKDAAQARRLLSLAVIYDGGSRSDAARIGGVTLQVTHCCAAWNKLVDRPWKIMSIGMRDWAHGF